MSGSICTCFGSTYFTLVIYIIVLSYLSIYLSISFFHIYLSIDFISISMHLILFKSIIYLSIDLILFISIYQSINQRSSHDVVTNVLNFDLLVIELELQFQYFKVKYEQHEFSWDMPFQKKSLHCISDKEILHLLILTHLCSSPFDENGTSSDNSHTRSFNVFDQHEKQLSIRHGRYADTINIKHINPKKKEHISSQTYTRHYQNKCHSYSS